jgi:xanthosine utilization system XapX-like protein
MDRKLLYAVAGCFVGTLASIFLNDYKPDPFLLFLLPLWGLILGVSIARVIDMYNPPEESKLEIKPKHLKKQK